MLSRCVVYSKPSHLPGHTTISLSLELDESCQLTPCIDIVLNRTWKWTFESFTTFNWVIALGLQEMKNIIGPQKYFLPKIYES